MKRKIITIVAIIIMGMNMFADTIQNNKEMPLKESKTEILSNLASLPGVSVTYLTKRMLQRLPKDKAESPLRILVDRGNIASIRVFELGNSEAEAVGKKLINAYISEIPDYSNIDPTLSSSPLELLMLQNNTSNEVIMYGIKELRDISYYETVLMYSKQNNKKAILIILTGNIHENVIGDLIDSFSK